MMSWFERGGRSRFLRHQIKDTNPEPSRQEHSRNILQGAAAAFGAVLSIQCGALVAKSIIPLVGGFGVTALRVGIGAALLVLIRRPWRRRLDLRTARYVVLYGIALSGLNLAFYKSLETLPLGTAVTIELLGPIVVACNPSRRIDLLWVALALIGLVELLPRGELVHASGRGALFALLAALCWAAYILIARRAQRSEVSDLVGFGIAMSAMIVIPVGIVSAGSRLIDIAILPTALCIGILSTAIPYALDYIAIKRLGAETFSLALCVHPAVATLLGAIFLHERITQSAMLATLCVTTAAGGRFVSTAFVGRSTERG